MSPAHLLCNCALCSASVARELGGQIVLLPGQTLFYSHTWWGKLHPQNNCGGRSSKLGQEHPACLLSVISGQEDGG